MPIPIPTNINTTTHTNTHTDTHSSSILIKHYQDVSRCLKMPQDVSSTLSMRQARYARLGRLVDGSHATQLFSTDSSNWWATHGSVMFCAFHVLPNLPNLPMLQLDPFDPCTLHHLYLSAMLSSRPDPINCSCGGRWFKGYKRTIQSREIMGNLPGFGMTRSVEIDSNWTVLESFLRCCAGEKAWKWIVNGYEWS